MKYFTINEMCKSSTAQIKRIDNNPNEDQKEALKSLINNVLDR